MKKLFLAVVMVMCFAIAAFAADTWTYRVIDVSKPNFTDIRISYEILLNNEVQTRSEIVLSLADTSSKTLVQIKSLADYKIKTYISDYIKLYSVMVGAKSLIGQEVAAQ